MTLRNGRAHRSRVFLSLGRHDYSVPYISWDEFKGKFPSLSYNLF